MNGPFHQTAAFGRQRSINGNHKDEFQLAGYGRWGEVARGRFIEIKFVEGGGHTAGKEAVTTPALTSITLTSLP